MYYTKLEPFGLTLPNLYSWVAVLLIGWSIFAVIFWTRGQPNLWKRLLVVSVFSVISLIIPMFYHGCRELTYEAALRSLPSLEEEYWEKRLFYEQTTDDREFDAFRVQREKKRWEDQEEMIKKYEEKYSVDRE